MSEQEFLDKAIERAKNEGGGLFAQYKWYIIGSCVLLGVGWYLFSSGSFGLFGNSRNIESRFTDLEKQYKNIEDEQRLSTERLERIESGISKSIGTVGTIRTEISGVRETLQGARSTLDGVRQRSEECNRRLQENDRAIAECESILTRIEKTNSK